MMGYLLEKTSIHKIYTLYSSSQCFYKKKIIYNNNINNLFYKYVKIRILT